jgi:hypothetical protein
MSDMEKANCGCVNHAWEGIPCVHDKQLTLTNLLTPMDIPLQRRELNKHNLLWLNRNLGIRNPNCAEAMALIKDLLLHHDKELT